MLKKSEILELINADKASDTKSMARTGQRYYDGDHDIKHARLFYYNSDGQLREDKTRSNVKIPHTFYTEIVDQAVQYMLSSNNSIVRADKPELQEKLDPYFNDDDFISELSETLTGTMTKGFDYMYAYTNEEDRIAFQNADSLGVVEVRAKDTDDGCEYVIYWYIDRVDKGKKKIKRIQVWDTEKTYYYVQTDDGEITEDDSAVMNPKPHTSYTKSGDQRIYYEDFGFIPFFRLDNNKKRTSGLNVIKGLIDDYDMMASSLSNNLVDFDTPIHVIKGFQGDNLEELQQNLKTKKLIGVDDDGGVEVHTVDVPYQARLTKLELDEKNIYRFGMGLNTAGLKDTAATTNIAIKAAYSLLELKCYKLEIRVKQLLKKLIKIVVDEINRKNETDYQSKDVYIKFEHEIMSNALENAQIKQTEAQTEQVQITTLLNLASQLDNETLMESVCDVLDIDYKEIKGKLPNPEDSTESLRQAQAVILDTQVNEE